MCTVTFLSLGHMKYITSNRDEHISRKAAVFPTFAQNNRGTLLYPEDGEAGGSWVTLKSTRDAGVLLNGGVEKHSRKDNYTRSRGLIFLEIMEAANPEEKFSQIDLITIEPFTIIVYVQAQLFECIWTGDKKLKTKLNTSNSYIWSSVTLYNKKQRKERAYQFEQKVQNEIFSEQHIWDFHQLRDPKCESRDIQIKREAVCTVSITMMALNEASGKMVYKDLRPSHTSSKTSNMYFESV